MAATKIPVAASEDAVSRMRRLQSERRARGGNIMAGVLSAYLGTARDRLLEPELDLLIDSFLLVEDAAACDQTRSVGRLREGRALAVIGGSGAGKSRTLNRHFLKREEFAGYGDPNSDCMLVSATAHAPCTLRLLGMSVLEGALGYNTTRELKENVVWDLVKHQLEVRGIRFLHIDELQHVQQSRNSVEIGKVQDTLKGLMQNPRWPVWLILSGLPSITTMLSGDEDEDEGDEQVWRRTRYVVFEDLKLERDAPVIRQLLKLFAGDKAGLSITSLNNDEFIARLLHASVYRLGIAIELVQDAIWNALLQGTNVLAVDHFAVALAARTGCRLDANIFTAAPSDWHQIDPRSAIKHRISPWSEAEGESSIKFKAPRDVRNK